MILIIVLFRDTLILHTGISLNGIPLNSAVGVVSSGKTLNFLEDKTVLFSFKKTQDILTEKSLSQCL